MYKIRYFFDYLGECLWAGNEETRTKFGYQMSGSLLPISKELKCEIEKLTTLFNTSLNWDYPPDPTPWSLEEIKYFEKLSDELLLKLKKELGANYTIVDERSTVE